MTTDFDEILREWLNKNIKEKMEIDKPSEDMFKAITKIAIKAHCNGCISTIKDVWMLLHDGEEMPDA